MPLGTVLGKAFELLRANPLLFLPRLVLMAVASVIWIVLIGEVEAVWTVGAVDMARLGMVGAALIVLTPLQVWTYNAYFILVDRHQASFQDIREAYRSGISRLPHALAAFLLPVPLMILLMLPGAALFGYGTVQAAPLLQLYGALFTGAAFLLIVIAFFFVPVAVVLGEGTFTGNVRDGIAAARGQPRAVVGITVASFLLLLSTVFLEGVLKQVGVIGFLVGRGISTVVSVYLLVVNPELYLAASD